MDSAFRSVYFCIVLYVNLICFALAQDVFKFMYHGFYQDPQLRRDGLASVQGNGLLQLTARDDTSQRKVGHAFYPFPIKFNISSSQSLSFSTSFVFAIIPDLAYANIAGHGIAFVVSPSMDFRTAEALPSQYLGLFNVSNIGSATNHILAIELDTVQDFEFGDIDDNHVGIDVNSLISLQSATAAYFSEKEGINKTLKLKSGDPMQIWIDYRGDDQLLSVTLAPITISKPNRPLLSRRIDLSQIFLEDMYVGFSASTGLLLGEHCLLGWSFSKNGQAQNLNISNLPSLPLSPPSAKKYNVKPSPAIVVLIVAAVILLIAIAATVYLFRRKKYEEIYEDWEREFGPQRFSYKNLYTATKGFNDKEVVGKGGFGKVYRGVLPSNVQIAVKRVSHDSEQGVKEFVAEIVSMGRLRHRHLVKLRGYCRLSGEFLLVYDYMPNGSLDKILHGNTKPNPNWFQRFRIIRGVASGLLYLHEDWEQVVLHRDIKPANVLLDNDLNGRLGDFGLARLYDHGSTLQTTKLVGTFGYMAPEIMRTGKASTCTDVYAFGVFMLEVACGRRPIDREGFDEGVNLVNWVTDNWKRGAILESSDPRLEGLYAEEQMELVLKLGLFCSLPNPAARPSMRQVMQYLDGEVTLPDIPHDGGVMCLLSETVEASEIDTLFPSLTGNNSSAYTFSTIDSILTVGR